MGLGSPTTDPELVRDDALEEGFTMLDPRLVLYLTILALLVYAVYRHFY